MGAQYCRYCGIGPHIEGHECVGLLNAALAARGAEIERLTEKIGRLESRGITDMQHEIERQRREIEDLRSFIQGEANRFRAALGEE